MKFLERVCVRNIVKKFTHPKMTLLGAKAHAVVRHAKSSNEALLALNMAP